MTSERGARLRRLGAAAVLLTGLALAGCGERVAPSAPGAGGGFSTDGASGTWSLVEGRGPKGEVKIIADHPITLTFEEDQLGGTAACNSYGGEVVIEGSRFTLSGLSGTEMGCRPAVMEAEYTYTAALLNVDEIERGEDTLLLRGPDSELHFELLPPVPTAELVRTEWLLESLIEGTGPDGIAIEADPARLMLHEDGTVSGTTGCRELSGEWTERGNEILFSSFSADGNCSAARREQDDHVVNVLGDGFVPEIDGRTLWLTSRGGFGLHYRAAD